MVCGFFFSLYFPVDFVLRPVNFSYFRLCVPVVAFSLVFSLLGKKISCGISHTGRASCLTYFRIVDLWISELLNPERTVDLWISELWIFLSTLISPSAQSWPQSNSDVGYWGRFGIEFCDFTRIFDWTLPFRSSFGGGSPFGLAIDLRQPWYHGFGPYVFWKRFRPYWFSHTPHTSHLDFPRVTWCDATMSFCPTMFYHTIDTWPMGSFPFSVDVFGGFPPYRTSGVVGRCPNPSFFIPKLTLNSVRRLLCPRRFSHTTKQVLAARFTRPKYFVCVKRSGPWPYSFTIKRFAPLDYRDYLVKPMAIFGLIWLSDRFLWSTFYGYESLIWDSCISYSILSLCSALRWPGVWVFVFPGVCWVCFPDTLALCRCLGCMQKIESETKWHLSMGCLPNLVKFSNYISTK